MMSRSYRLLERKETYEQLLLEFEKRGALKVHYTKILDLFINRYIFGSFHVFFTRLDELPNADFVNNMIFYLNDRFPYWDKEYNWEDLPEDYKFIVRIVKIFTNKQITDIDLLDMRRQYKLFGRK